MPLMGSLYVGSSGLQTSQNALNTTAHNLSNMETTGYVRQQVQQSSRSYLTLSVDVKSVNNKQTGLGVTYSRVKHIRDFFLDKAYRRESGRSMFYQVSSDVMEEVESQLGELNGEAFQGTLTDFWTAIQELAKDPASSVTQGLLVQRAAEFVQRAEAVYDGFCAYQDNLNAKVKDQVDKINAYGKQLTKLNEAIRSIEAGGIESANDMRDARDQILDELAEMADIDFAEDVNGNVWVKVEGMDFVKGDKYYEIGLHTDDATGFYTPFWFQNATFKTLPNGTREYNIDGAEVFNLNKEISSDLNTDIGGLKAILLARGDHRADYTDVADPEKYKGVSQSVIMNIQAEFDQLIHNVATKVNEILAGAAGVKVAEDDIKDANGNLLVKKGEAYCDSTTNGYMRKDDGSPIQMFAKVASEGYRKVTATVNVTDDQGNVTGTEERDFWIYNEEAAGKAETLYSIKNLQIDDELMQKPSMLEFRLEDGSEDKATAEALKDAFLKEDYSLNPNVKKKATFVDYYDDLVAQVANSGYAFRSIYTNQEGTVESIYAAREQVAGVSSDEELSNMIKFQNAYNASSRYINVIDEMLEHLLSTLGV
ncbi:MAG: flagellar hook-associated protein FlgK [Lachnospiraceae bacterium]|jgi:flagellar hook-associated protein 1 FlgK|nr:flagellar hook-associated protein FlgK [Lachnospiraceae bacterium]